MDALQYLLGPTVSIDDFFSQYWLKKPLHTRNDDPLHWDSLFSVETDVEPMWRRAHKSPDVLYFTNCKGSARATAPLVTSAKLPSPFYAYANRFSVVLNKADQHSPAIRTICEALARPSLARPPSAEGTPTITHFPYAFCNVYLTPPNAQTVPKHSDDRDVLLLQVMGSKEWSIYSDPSTASGMPLWLPYRDEEVGKVEGRPAPTALEPILRTTVKQGDFLYIPRGFVHEASTSEEASLHLTIALQSSDWDLASALGRSVTSALRSNPGLIPLTRVPRMGELTGTDEGAALNELIRQAVEGLFSGDKPAVTGRSLQRDFSSHISRIDESRRDGFPLPAAPPGSLLAHPLCGGQPSPYARLAPEAVLPLTGSTQLVWVSTIEVLGVEQAGDDMAVPLVITFGDTTHKRSMQLAVSEEMAGVALFLSKRGSFPTEVSDLPCLVGGDSSTGLLLRQICAAHVLIHSAVVHRFRN